MRIVIDMQGAQTESRFRGIGRYTLSFSQAIVRNRGRHEVILALSGLFPDTIEPIRAAFDGLLAQENIRVWQAPGRVLEQTPGNDARREAAELIRESFLVSLVPDVIHLSSLFEGYGDDAVSSIGRFDHSTPVSVSLYDLIPLLNADHYLKPNLDYERFYLRKVEYLKKATIYLAISEFSRQEGLEHLDAARNSIVNVSTAIESHFQPIEINDADSIQLLQKFGLNRPFVLYTGGADERKNLSRLIQAFAALPSELRAGHQLLLAGKMPEGNIAEFHRIAETANLNPDELCFTGYVTDEELIQLYNLCQLYVFPSWHEGFGLPALEAMACGAPVIGANTSSLPEVIGLDSALFDPFNVAAITAKMAQALSDDLFRDMLREHGFQQAKKFSWDTSAKRAIAAWEGLHARNNRANSYIDRSLSRDKLFEALAQCNYDASLTPLLALAADIAQNETAGIERQLMLDISELCQKDAATGVQRVVRSYLQALLKSPPPGFRIEPVYALRNKGYRYARRFTQRFLCQDAEHVIDAPMQWQRGDVFFGLDMQHHVQLAQKSHYQQLRRDGVVVKFLVHDLLPVQLAELFKDSNAKELHEQWLAMIAATDGAICVSKATADVFSSWIDVHAIHREPNFQMAWVHNGGDIEGSNPSRGFPTDAQAVLAKICSRPSFLCVATLEPRKGQRQIIDAFQLLWDEGLDVSLVLVGPQGWKVEALAEAINNHPEQGQRFFWLQGISDEYLEQVYRSSTCLIAASINEGFGLPLIEAARHGTPIIARDIPVFREVAGECAYYFSGETPSDLTVALKLWLSLNQEGCHPKSDQLRWSTWEESTVKLKAALIQDNYPRRQLLVDVSELVQRDAKSGIQRVVRSIVKEWLNQPPAGYRVELVYATADSGYRYARRFTQIFLDRSDEELEDEPIDYGPGDAFIGLDFQPQVIPAQRVFFQVMRRQGVHVQFVVYDLLCVLMPKLFPHGAADGFRQWLGVIAECDGALCISKAVADELTLWLKDKGPIRQRRFTINWFHLGADVYKSAPAKTLPSDVYKVLDRFCDRTSFLMVGTLEPRKGHAQVLAAFEQLWQSNIDVNLVIVGKKGWQVENLTELLHTHPERQKRLFWLEGINDEYLERVYQASSCLIAASEGEGFGLPLIEAAQHGLPLIARDLPVFREVAGDHALYFHGLTPNDLVSTIETWLILYASGTHPTSEGMPWLTWRRSAEILIKQIVK